MDKLEINPTLFITCRLCLGDLGVYQIVPAVKEQILYCFDIEVEPFDGLPQVICKKCEATLSSFSALKKKIIEKQNDLRSKIQQRLQNGQMSKVQPLPAGCSQSIEFESNENLYKTRKRPTCISTSSSDLEYDKPSKANIKKEDSQGNEEHDSENETKSQGSWARSYTRQYVCRICNVRSLNVQSLKTHINSSHSLIKKKFKNIFKTHCEVILHKIEDKLNATGCRSKVMHSREKIIENVNPEYYIMYTSKNSRHDEAPRNNKARNFKSKKRLKSISHKSSDSTDEEIVVSRKRTKRLFSRSSNDTVVLDAENKSNLSDYDKESRSALKVHTPVESGDCINIDDSSDESETENIKNKMTSNTEKQISDINNEDLTVNKEEVHSIICNSENKYTKKHSHNNFITKSTKHPSDVATQLKRKILSIGRKIINKKKAINCTPLLRFIEHKNADVIWFPRSIMYYVNQESDFVRIMARSRNIGENDNYESGWADTSNQTKVQLFGAASSSSKSSVVASQRQPSEGTNVIHSDPKVGMVDSAVLIADPNCNGYDTKKLLNANPVANPKQLPKKPITNETKASKFIVIKPDPPNIEITAQENEFCMPIITSTTSLAFPIQDNNNAPNDRPETKNDDHKPDAPRIKVKPVSELMSVETLNRMKEPTRVQTIFSPCQQISHTSTITQLQNTTQTQNTNIGLVTPDPTWNNDFMVLNTIELPNTRTNSPFQYFQKLLQLHNIILLDTDITLSKDFHCLIKFKVLYKQETNNQPVILCLGLFCSKNVFCLKIKDRNQENINISKISPNWQWEVLKIYKGEVVAKLLNNAQKLGQEVYEFTNSFLCLLKSITLL